LALTIDGHGWYRATVLDRETPPETSGYVRRAWAEGRMLALRREQVRVRASAAWMIDLERVVDSRCNWRLRFADHACAHTMGVG
jgi:hypothetical protein